MKTIDLRHQEVCLDELLRSIGGDAVRITSKDGEEFVLEAADAFEREAAELGGARRSWPSSPSGPRSLVAPRSRTSSRAWLGRRQRIPLSMRPRETE